MLALAPFAAVGWLIAQEPAPISAVAADEQAVFWVAQGELRARDPYGRGEIRHIATLTLGTVHQLELTPTYAVWRQQGSLWVVRREGGDPRRIRWAGSPIPVFLVDGEHVIWVEGTDAWTVPAGGGEKERLVGLEGRPATLAGGHDELTWAAGTRVLRWRRGAGVRVLWRHPTRIGRVALAEDDVYFEADRTVFRLAPMSPKARVVPGVRRLDGLCRAGFFQEQWFVPRQGGAPAARAGASDRPHLRVTDDWIYDHAADGVLERTSTRD